MEGKKLKSGASGGKWKAHRRRFLALSALSAGALAGGFLLLRQFTGDEYDFSFLERDYSDYIRDSARLRLGAVTIGGPKSYDPLLAQYAEIAGSVEGGFLRRMEKEDPLVTRGVREGRLKISYRKTEKRAKLVPESIRRYAESFRSYASGFSNFLMEDRDIAFGSRPDIEWIDLGGPASTRTGGIPGYIGMAKFEEFRGDLLVMDADGRILYTAPFIANDEKKGSFAEINVKFVPGDPPSLILNKIRYIVLTTSMEDASVLVSPASEVLPMSTIRASVAYGNAVVKEAPERYFDKGEADMALVSRLLDTFLQMDETINEAAASIKTVEFLEKYGGRNSTLSRGLKDDILGRSVDTSQGQYRYVPLSRMYMTRPGGVKDAYREYREDPGRFMHSIGAPWSKRGSVYVPDSL